MRQSVSTAAGTVHFEVTERKGRYGPGTLADVVETSGVDPAATIREELRGWVVRAPVALGTALLDGGATLVRHAHGLRKDLAAEPPPADWGSPHLGDGLRIVAADRPAAALLPAWSAAYGPEHPDHMTGSPDRLLRDHLEPILAGEVLGPILPSSALVVDADDQVLAGVLVADHTPMAWVGDLFRQPGRTPTGLGALLLRRACAHTADGGRTEIGLAVSDTNPARRLYERLGFRHTTSSITVRIE